MTKLEEDPSSDGRLRQWLVRTVEREPIDRFVIRHDTGAEVATIRADEGGTFERTERQLDELATELSERILTNTPGMVFCQRVLPSAVSRQSSVRSLPFVQTASSSTSGEEPRVMVRNSRMGYESSATTIGIGSRPGSVPGWPRSSPVRVANSAPFTCAQVSLHV